MAGTAGADTERQPTRAQKTVSAERFVAFVFDDVHLRFEDIVHVRDATRRYITDSLAPGDRAALITMSGQNMLDFTSDRTKLDTELLKLQPHTVARAGGGKRCPDITFYEADRLDRENNPYRETAALDAVTCEVLTCFPTMRLPDAQRLAIQVARDELTSGRFETRASLRVLQALVKRMALLPGDRTIVLVSPGFHLLSEHHPDETNVIDSALRYKVVLNALDARGLFEINPAGEIDDRSQRVGPEGRSITGGNPTMKALQDARYQSRVAEAEISSEVMADLASGTGGRLIENSNDYDEALHRLASAPEYVYLLGFSPTNLKSDGSFHPLKLRVTASGKLDVQAQRGYYAPSTKISAAEIARRAIEDAVFSSEEVKVLPLELHAQVSDSQLHVVAQFEGKEDRRELTLVAALFDEAGVFVAAHQNVMRAVNGLAQVKTDFEVKVGRYRVRLVIASSDGQVLAAVSGSAELPPK